MDEIRVAALLMAAVASMVACGDDAPVGVPPRTFSVLLAGTVVAENGHGVTGASLRTTAVIPQSSARDSVGSCRGLAGSAIPAVSDPAGRFSTRVSWIQPGPLCLGIEVSTYDYILNIDYVVDEFMLTYYDESPSEAAT